MQPAPDLNKDGAWLCRPLTCSETTMVSRCLLQIDDRDVTSHSLKTTCLSWAAKAERPREQRRLLGRHSSALQDADSVYARDLAVAPVKALQRVLLLIREGEFSPDQPRSDFFRGANPVVPGTPAPVFQPGTPAFLSKEAVVSHGPTVEQEDDWEHITPKKESECMEVNSTIPVSEIDLLSSSDSSSSTSGCEDVESDAEHEIEVDGMRRPPNENEFSLDAMVKNGKTGITHLVPDIAPGISESVFAIASFFKEDDEVWKADISRLYSGTNCARLDRQMSDLFQRVP